MNNRITRTIGYLTYLGLVPLALFSVMRIFRLEQSRTMIVIETATFYMFLPVYVVAAFAAVTRQRILLALSAGLILCHLTWTLPELLNSRELPSAAQNAPRMRLFSQNVLFENRTPQLLADQIRNADADLVFLQELNQRMLRALANDNAFVNYRYSFVSTEYGPTGLGIFSKFPLRNGQNIESPGFPQMRAIADVNGTDIALWNVHVKAPVDGTVESWKDDLRQLEQRTHGETLPTLVSGDFNATWNHRPYRDLLTNGFHEAAIDVGRGYARTWPADQGLGVRLGGFIRLDHTIYNRGLQATSLQEQPGNGSDHRGAVVALRIIAAGH